MSNPGAFSYDALDHSGRRRKGVVAASDERTAFQRLKQDGLTPLRLVPMRRDVRPSGTRVNAESLSQFLDDVATLLAAGADLKGALSILTTRAPDRETGRIAKALVAEIGGGAALEGAFARVLGERAAFVSGFVAAGEASGHLAAALHRAAKLLESERDIRAKLWGAISYPALVAVMAVVALGIILLAVVPSLAPLLEGAATRPPLAMRVLFGFSRFLTANGGWLASCAGLATLGLLAAWRLGVLQGVLDRINLDGPLSTIARQLTYGRLSLALGELLSAGVPVAEAIKITARSTPSALARKRVDQAGHRVRQGERLSRALDTIDGFPPTISHLARIGEEAGSLGPMLEKAGRIELDRGLRRIEALSQWLGPILIVALGALIGLLMAGLLTGVSSLGGAALD